jgi:hypothetical protein
MEAAGITATARNPSGGEIHKNTGVQPRRSAATMMASTQRASGCVCWQTVAAI